MAQYLEFNIKKCKVSILQVRT